MPKEKYQDRRFGAATRTTIERCNAVIEEYTGRGFTLTLRQLYYQLVARGVIPNRMREYKRLVSVVNDARLAGLIDWLAIEDRTRNLHSLAHWERPSEMVRAAAEQFRVDLWVDQPWRPEVWIEKDALLGVIEGVCEEFDVPFFSCRGYTSQSEMWSASQRLLDHGANGQTPIIFHLGDHDPSGKDMTRDIESRLDLFMGGCEIQRLALNMEQVRKFSPPPNPAKTTDSRYRTYIAEFGSESWELDALDPTVIAGLIRSAVMSLIDQKPWDERLEAIRQGQDQLSVVAKRMEKARKR